MKPLSLLGKIFFGSILMLLATMFIIFFPDNEKPIQIVKEDNAILADEYVVEKETVLSTIEKVAETATYKQSITRTYEDVDKSLFGKRVTEVKFKAYYILGFDHNNMHIDNVMINGNTVNVKLGEPILMSLDIPLDEIKNDKTNGILRKDMSVEEMKDLYSAARKQIKNDIMNDKNIIEQAKMHNEAIAKEMLLEIPGIDKVIFY